MSTCRSIVTNTGVPTAGRFNRGGYDMDIAHERKRLQTRAKSGLIAVVVVLVVSTLLQRLMESFVAELVICIGVAVVVFFIIMDAVKTSRALGRLDSTRAPEDE